MACLGAGFSQEACQSSGRLGGSQEDESRAQRLQVLLQSCQAVVNPPAGAPPCLELPFLLWSPHVHRNLRRAINHISDKVTTEHLPGWK